MQQAIGFLFCFFLITNSSWAGCGPGGNCGPQPGSGCHWEWPDVVCDGGQAVGAVVADRVTLQTATGIPVDTDWKKQVYDFAQKNVRHPAWGIAHSERDYQVALAVANREGISLDLDVLFACAFLHDLGGIAPFDKPGVDHAVRSAELVQPLLQQWGFPMAKWPQVNEMILGHTYYGPVPNSPQALAFRDADVLDFLGDIGIARILAITEEPTEGFDGTLKPTVATLQDFAKTMAAKCSLNSCHEMAQPRQDQLNRFLKNLNQQTFNATAL